MLFKSVIMAHLAAATFTRPAEWDRTSRVLMAWPSAQNKAYEDREDLRAAIKDVSAIADAIALFEPVTVYVTPDKVREAQDRFNKSKKIEVRPVEGYKNLDLWMRDMAPTFVNNGGKLNGVDYNFNGWGGKWPVQSNRSLASIIADGMNVPRVETWLVAEGGSLETDGDGTVLVTESSVINDNRNKHRTKCEIEGEIMRTLGATKVIWVPGRKGLDVTDSHIDGLVRFIAPGKVLLSQPSQLDSSVWTKIYQEAKDILSTATDAKGRKLHIVEIKEADMYKIGLDKKTLKDIESGDEDAPSLTYVNYLLVNDGVIFPQFGDKKADEAARRVIEDVYRDREIERVWIEEIPMLGGGIHCSTQEVPLLK